MSSVVVVYGIAQQQLGRHQLRQPWSLALADGLERASGHQVKLPDLNIAYFGDLLLNPGSDGGKGSVDQPDLDGEEQAVVVQAAEVLTEFELAVSRSATSS